MTIYMIRSPGPNGKSYIGKDSNFPVRMKDHRRIAAKEGHKEYNAPVHRAIRKYGWEKMVVTALDSRSQSLRELARRERLWIWIHRTHAHGYNQTAGGEGTIGYRHTVEARRKVALSRRGTKSSDATRRKISEAGQLRKQSPETRARISASHLGKILSKATRLQISDARRGIPLSDEHRLAITQSVAYLKGVPRPPEVCARIKQSHLTRRKNLAEFIGPQGERVVTRDIKAFAVQFSLGTGKLYLMLNGKRPQHKGWRGRWLEKDGNPETAILASRPKKIFLSRDEAMRAKRCVYVYELTDPYGRIYDLTDNLSGFCKEHTLDQRKMCLVVKNGYGRKSYKGWTGRILSNAEISAAGFITRQARYGRALENRPSPKFPGSMLQNVE